MSKYKFSKPQSWVHQVLMPSFAQDWPLLPVDRAEGAYLYTVDGKRILDFTSGIAVANVGHGHPRVLAAAQAQMMKFVHSSVGITLHETLLQLALALGQVTPGNLDMFFFGNSGAEAVEGSLKLRATCRAARELSPSMAVSMAVPMVRPLLPRSKQSTAGITSHLFRAFISLPIPTPTAAR